MAYFCCSAGLSAGFGGLVWFCCGLAGVLGFCSFEPTGVLVIVKPSHEYLKNIFQVHSRTGNWIAEYKISVAFIFEIFDFYLSGEIRVPHGNFLEIQSPVFGNWRSRFPLHMLEM
jgi:hypothetical protein